MLPVKWIQRIELIQALESELLIDTITEIVNSNFRTYSQSLNTANDITIVQTHGFTANRS